MNARHSGCNKKLLVFTIFSCGPSTSNGDPVKYIGGSWQHRAVRAAKDVECEVVLVGWLVRVAHPHNAICSICWPCSAFLCSLHNKTTEGAKGQGW